MNPIDDKSGADEDAAKGSPVSSHVPRSTLRKVLRTPIAVELPSGAMLYGRTIDVGVGGASLLLPQPLPLASQCTVRLTVFVSLTLQAKVIHCTLSGVDGFKVGLMFSELSAASAQFLMSLTK